MMARTGPRGGVTVLLAAAGLYLGQVCVVVLSLPAVLSPLVGVGVGVLLGRYVEVNRERTLADRTRWGGREDDLRAIAEQVDAGRAPTSDPTSRELARRYAADEAELGRFTRRLQGALVLLFVVPSLLVPTRGDAPLVEVAAVVAVVVVAWTVWHGWVVPRRYERVVAFLDAAGPPR
ncbi:hypothetical protein [Rhodococcus aerolatus]